eukprot:7326270-Pyramimonas_sp.AAC.3
MDGGDSGIEPEGVAQHACDGASMLELAPDGSRAEPALLDLQRAGWAIVLLTPDGPGPLLAVHGTVPPAVPQTLAVAEYLGLA